MDYPDAMSGKREAVLPRKDSFVHICLQKSRVVLEKTAKPRFVMQARRITVA